MTPNPSLASLYQSVILEHNANPRGRGPLPGATHQASRDNPLCGDRITLRLRLAPDGDHLLEAGYEADGCALSIASASLLADRVAGQPIAEVHALIAEVRSLLSRGQEHEQADRARLGDLVALEGTRQFPARLRCALLPWEALAAALPAAPTDPRSDG